MSFGFGVGDFIAVGQLCWKVYKKCKESPGNFAQLSAEVSSLQAVIKETEELVSEQSFSPEQVTRLSQLRQGCEAVLNDLEKSLVKYESLGTRSQRALDRFAFGMEDMKDMRERITSNILMLDAFNNASSHAKLEKKLNILIAEVCAGKREGSVISTTTIDTVARNNQEMWEEFSRELEDVGVTRETIIEKRHFIIAWFQEAVAAGRLEEETLLEDNDGALAASDEGSSDERVIAIDNSHDKGPSMTRTDDRSVKRVATKTATKTDHPPNRLKDKPLSASPNPFGARHLIVSYLINRLQGKDKMLIKAVSGGEEGKVRDLIAMGAEVDIKDGNSMPALISAAKHGHMSIVMLLLEKGAQIEARDLIDKIALHHAAERGFKSIVKLLLDKGAQINAKRFDGESALIIATLYGHEDIVELLVEEGAQMEATCKKGWNALIVAAKTRQVKMVKLLIEKGAQIDAKDPFGRNPLNYAVETGDGNIVKLLLENKAQIDANKFSQRNTLSYAVEMGHEHIVKLLIEKGAPINARDYHRESPLSYAVKMGHEHIVKLLIENGAQIDALAMIDATRKGFEDIVKLLLEKGALVEAKDYFGRTGLSYAAGNGHERIVRLLLESGASVRPEDKDGWTALAWAQDGNHSAVADILRDAENRLREGHNPRTRAS